MKAVYIGYVAGIIWTLIPFVYRVTAPDWRRTRVGRAFMYLVASTAGLFALLLTGGLFGDYPLRELVRGAVYAAVLVAGLHLIGLFIRLRVEGDRRLREELAETLKMEQEGRL